MSVARAEVAGSAILVETGVEFSAEFNAVIGGRGTGKSSFLEYIAFGLGRSCHDVEREHYSGNRRMRELIADTVVSKGASVSLEITQDQARFTIVRGPETAYQPQIGYPDGATQAVTVKELRGLFPAVVYGQRELSEIGRQTGDRAQLSDLLQFIDADHKHEDERLGLRVESAQGAVRSGVRALVRTWRLQAQLRELKTNQEARRQRLAALQGTLPDLLPEDQAVIDHFELAEDFETRRLQTSRSADELVDALVSISGDVQAEDELESAVGAVGAEGAEVARRHAEFRKTFRTGVTSLEAELIARRAPLADAEQVWAETLQASRAAHRRVLEKLKAHKSVTRQMTALREEISTGAGEIGDVDADLRRPGDTAEELQAAIGELRQANAERNARTEEWAAQIEDLSAGKVKATVVAERDVSEIREAIDTLSAKTGSQEATRVRELDGTLSNAPVADVLDRLRLECLSLLYWRHLGAAIGEEEPECGELMRILGRTDNIRRNLRERLDAAQVEAIATAVAGPEVTLSYSDVGRYIPFEKASEGQRAAALLFILLEQSGGPLIVDQPEGDLDNRVIAELTEKLHGAKANRQLIFASHNANIVVNGAAELVCQLDLTSGGKRGFVLAGAIDKPAVCQVIATTMEGGERAFRDRQAKYGY